jgi:hypothetical protein
MINRSAQLFLGVSLAFSCGAASSAVWLIGDNDGYGQGIADGANHPFNGSSANYDGRSLAEQSATEGAQYTDTYSTTQTGYGPQPGTTATFRFTGLGNAWTQGSMWFDLADFQASTFGAVRVTYNGIVQDWAFNDGFPQTKIHFFDLSQSVLDTINATGTLTIVVDRNASTDFYGFDYALLSDRVAADGVEIPDGDVPLPSSIALLGLGLVALRSRLTKRG